MLLAILLGLVSLAGLLILRIYLILPSRITIRDAATSRTKARPAGSTCSTAIFLGSGGHTSEMKSLLSTLPFERYTPRTYIYCHGDEMSLRAVAALESDKGTVTSSEAYTLLPLPRARRVAEPPLRTLLSASKTLLAAVWAVFVLPLLSNPRKPFADVLIVNGPGTCVVLVAVSWIRRILALPYTKIIYVESFARVKSLSLSGKLVRPFVDRFIVQWPEAGARVRAPISAESISPSLASEPQDRGKDRYDNKNDGTAECRGWLV